MGREGLYTAASVRAGEGERPGRARRASRVLEAAVTKMPLDVAGFFGRGMPFGRTDFGDGVGRYGWDFSLAGGCGRVYQCMG